jgi:hypothetical protein
MRDPRIGLPPEQISMHRRQLIGAIGATVAGVSLAGCATAPALPPRPMDPALAPRAGNTWVYHYSSIFRAVPPRPLEVRLQEVGPAGLRDRITMPGAPTGEEHTFSSALEVVERPLDGLVLYDLSPYLQAFGPLPAEGLVAVPLPNWGPPFRGLARRRGNEQVTVPAGTFDATRFDYDINRSPGGTLQPRSDPVFTLASVWYAPGAKRAVQWQVTTRGGALNILVGDTYQLASYRAA